MITHKHTITLTKKQIMEAKEKAKEILKKFEDESLHFEDTIRDTAKYNSLLCVDEIINEIYNNQEYPRYNYWNEVKNHIVNYGNN